MTQIVEIKDNPFWEHDVDEAIDNFKAEFGVAPHMYIGKNFIEMVTTKFGFIHREEPVGTIMKYKGTPCEYDSDISCVILKA